VSPNELLKDISAALCRLHDYEKANSSISLIIHGDARGWSTPEVMLDAIRTYRSTVDKLDVLSLAREKKELFFENENLKSQLESSKKDYAAALEKIVAMGTESVEIRIENKKLLDQATEKADAAVKAANTRRIQSDLAFEALRAFRGSTMLEKIDDLKSLLDISRSDDELRAKVLRESEAKLLKIRNALSPGMYETELEKIAEMREERNGLVKRIISLEAELEASEKDRSEAGAALQRTCDEAHKKLKEKDAAFEAMRQVAARYEEASEAIALALGFGSKAWPNALALKEHACRVIASLKHQVDDIGKRLQQAQDLERSGHTRLCQDVDKWRMEAQRLGDVVKRFEMVLAGRKVDGEM
jgi:hypothetical protein